jgi:hypothetical protein
LNSERASAAAGCIRLATDNSRSSALILRLGHGATTAASHDADIVAANVTTADEFEPSGHRGTTLDARSKSCGELEQGMPAEARVT